MRSLLVEDEEGCRKVFQGFLSEFGEVDGCENGQVGIDVKAGREVKQVAV